MDFVTINDNDVKVKEWNGQRVVTFKDIDRVHNRPDGTARKRFNDNKNYFIEDEDYFKIKKSLMSEKRTLGIEVPNRGITVFTESGYLLLVKSFNDDLAWKVQRELVNAYFRFKEVVETLQPSENNLVLSEGKFLEAVQTIEDCAGIFRSMIDYSTINYKQQQELLQTARKRVNHLLGGAHSEEYKEYSRIYFKNLWQDFCKQFECGSYKDLNPIHMVDDTAKNWILDWEYSEK